MPQFTRIGIDVGGTFTDAALVTGSGALVTTKVPSTDDQSRGVMAALRKACRMADLSPSDIDRFIHSMTVSVNALLEETGARTALVTTRGFRDVLEIGRQNRPALYDLDADKPAPLVPRRRRLEAAERATVDGIVRPVDEVDIHTIAERLEQMDIESAAVCFLHAYAYPDNERTTARILRDKLDVPISVSHEILAEFREYERTSTTVVNAYLTPEMNRYLSRLETRAEDAGAPIPRVMQANGGTAQIGTVRKRAVTTIMSGPAAGVVGAQAATTNTGSSGPPRAGDGDPAPSPAAGIITFDMGGTSSDVSLIRDGNVTQTTDTTINGRPIRVPMVDVDTVGAGGGSIAWVDGGGALRVGPQSAGAEPGPACYGNGGTKPTVTDANLVLGYLGATSRLGGELTLDASAAREVIRDLADEAGLDDDLEAARGVHDIANAAMTRAIRSVTVERGYNPREYTLAAFGGAGPMHASTLAAALDIDRVLVPRACGVLSAFGLLAADEKYDAVRTVRTGLDGADRSRLERRLDDLTDGVSANLSDRDAADITYTADLRYRGQSFELTVSFPRPIDLEQTADAFHRIHERTYGYRLDEPVELVNLRTAARIPGRPPTVTFRGGDGTPIDEREAFFEDGFLPTPVYSWPQLYPDQTLAGPAVVEQRESTVVIPPDWSGAVRNDGTLVLCR